MPPADSNFSSQLANKAKWPLFLVANIAILFVVGVSTIRETYRGWSVDREIIALEQKAASLEGRRGELAAFADKMQSPQYVEREARAKLGLQKPGEHVIILEGVSATSSEWSIEITPPPPVAIDTRSNPKRWWDYFTKPAT
ncbi:MAG: septum formation initiator family protein [Patescibacteria group bacterium]|nr:septum formation initiator family protein [Patescibacteria group bacterium]